MADEKFLPGHDENWFMPDQIIDSGYQEYEDPNTGLKFTEYDLAAFAIKAVELKQDRNVFRSVPFVFENDEQKELYWTKIILPHMNDPERKTIIDMVKDAEVKGKQLYEEALGYIPIANRPKET